MKLSASGLRVDDQITLSGATTTVTSVRLVEGWRGLQVRVGTTTMGTLLLDDALVLEVTRPGDPGNDGPAFDPITDAAIAAVLGNGDSATARRLAVFGRKDGIDLRDWTDFDATGNNSNSSVLAAAMAQAVDGDVIRIPRGLIAMDNEWAITKNVSIIGAGVHDVYPGLGTAVTFDNPTVAPYLTGSVFLQTAAAKNGLSVTKSAASVKLQGFGVRFADAIRFTNTGHGVSGVSTATFNGGHDHGLVAFKIEDVRVYGHDGNHYGLHMINPLHGTINDFRSYGGGGMHVECDSFGGNYGNLVVNHPFAHLFCPGTANGYNLRGRVASGTSGVLNLMTFVRPQCNSTDQTARYGKAATASQYLFRASQPASTNALTVLNPDFETMVNSPVDFGGGSNFIDPAGIFGASSDAASRTFRVFRSTQGAKGLNSDMTFSNVNTPGPTVAAGAGLGTGGTATVAAGGDDLAGTIDFVAGSASTAAFQPLFTVTWGRLTAATTVMLTPRNGSTAPLNLYVSNVSGTGFTVNAAVAPTTGATYKASFLVTR